MTSSGMSCGDSLSSTGNSFVLLTAFSLFSVLFLLTGIRDFGGLPLLLLKGLLSVLFCLFCFSEIDLSPIPFRPLSSIEILIFGSVAVVDLLCAPVLTFPHVSPTNDSEIVVSLSSESGTGELSSCKLKVVFLHHTNRGLEPCRCVSHRSVSFYSG